MKMKCANLRVEPGENQYMNVPTQTWFEVKKKRDREHPQAEEKKICDRVDSGPEPGGDMDVQPGKNERRL